MNSVKTLKVVHIKKICLATKRFWCTLKYKCFYNKAFNGKGYEGQISTWKQRAVSKWKIQTWSPTGLAKVSQNSVLFLGAKIRQLKCNALWGHFLAYTDCVSDQEQGVFLELDLIGREEKKMKVFQGQSRLSLNILSFPVSHPQDPITENYCDSSTPNFCPEPHLFAPDVCYQETCPKTTLWNSLGFGLCCYLCFFIQTLLFSLFYVALYIFIFPQAQS